MVRAENATGSRRNGRTELQVLLDFMPPKDTLVVTRIDRIARCMKTAWPCSRPSSQWTPVRLFVFLRLPPSQWKSVRNTNAIERLHEEFKRRFKPRTAPPSAETAAMLFWALMAWGQIIMRQEDARRDAG